MSAVGTILFSEAELQTEEGVRSYVHFTNRKDPHRLLSFCYGVDISLRRFASGIRADIQCCRLPKPYKNVSRRVRRLHDPDHGADYHLYG